jgi:hypothetical protein
MPQISTEITSPVLFLAISNDFLAPPLLSFKIAVNFGSNTAFGRKINERKCEISKKSLSGKASAALEDEQVANQREEKPDMAAIQGPGSFSALHLWQMRAKLEYRHSRIILSNKKWPSNLPLVQARMMPKAQ